MIQEGKEMMEGQRDREDTEGHEGILTVVIEQLQWPTIRNNGSIAKEIEKEILF